MNADLKQALKNQGEQLVKRADWLQRMIERQAETISNCQKTLDYYSHELTATNTAIDALREAYRNQCNERRDG